MTEEFEYYSPEYGIIDGITWLFLFYIFGLFLFNKRKEKKLVDRESEYKINYEKTRIADEIHDDIGADLSNLLFKLRIYQNTLHNQNMEDYNDIERFTKEVIKKVNETIWSLSSEKDNLGALSNFMLKYLDDYFANSTIHYSFKARNFNADFPIAIEIRRSIYSAFKDTLDMLLKHIDVNNLEINLNHENKQLNIEILCNGLQNVQLSELEKNTLELLEGKGLFEIKCVINAHTNPLHTNQINIYLAL